MMYKAVPLLAAMTILSGCTYDPIKSLAPVQKDGFWRKGVRFVESDAKGSSVLMGYSQYYADGYMFDTIIHNTSQQVQEFSPAGIRCIEYDQNHKVIESSAAVDPEKKLQEITQRLQPYEETPGGMALLNSVASITSMFDQPRTAQELKQQQKERADEDAAKAENEAERQDLQREQAMYRTGFLRNHSMGPRETIAGKVVCHRLHKATTQLEVDIPVGDASHKLVWNAAIIK